MRAFGGTYVSNAWGQLEDMWTTLSVNSHVSAPQLCTACVIDIVALQINN